MNVVGKDLEELQNASAVVNSPCTLRHIFQTEVPDPPSSASDSWACLGMVAFPVQLYCFVHGAHMLNLHVMQDLVQEYLI